MDTMTSKDEKNLILLRYPELQCALDAIHAELGITFEQMQCNNNTEVMVDARLIFASLCYEVSSTAMGKLMNKTPSCVSRMRSCKLSPSRKKALERVKRKYNDIINAKNV